MDPGSTPATVERRIVSVLFADLVGFTSLSESLDPEDVATVQDAYFAAVRETIGRYGGRLEKFIGDAAMAVFGIPRGRDDDAERAVRAGLALTGAVEQLAARVGLEGGTLRLRVGVNTGEVVTTEAGVDEWRVTGDTVNTAARFQTAAPPGGVVVGETTSLAVADAVELESMGSLELKGKAEPVRAWLAVAVRPVAGREHAMGGLRAPILGRESELGALIDSLDRARAGGTERWTLVAPPGTGKSRLLEEFADRAAATRPAILRARLRPDVLAPYDAVAQLIGGALVEAGAAPEELIPDRAPSIAGLLMDRLKAGGTAEGRAGVVAEAALSVLFPPAEAGPGAMRPAAGDRAQRFQAWIEALDGLAAGPCVWLVEDAHWSGGDLLAFLDEAGRAPSSHGRLVVATARPSLLERAAEWCAHGPEEGRHQLPLPSLAATDAERLVTALIGDALPAALTSAVAERSDGNPLFIEELLRTWISVGTLVRDGGGRWRLGAPADTIPLPPTVQAIYAAQIDDLPPDARSAARRASVAGRRFPVGALPSLGVEQPEPAVEVLSRRALVAGPYPDLLLGRSYQFRHALLRDAGYASLAHAERARLHLRLARWLEGSAGHRPAEVAEVIGNHYRAALSSAPRLAPDVGEGVSRGEAAALAASWFERAAEAALEVSADLAARALLRQALDLTAHDLLLDRARRLERLADATAYVADMEEAVGQYEQAIDLYRSVFVDPSRAGERAAARDGLARATASLGLVRIQQLRFKEAAGLADGALDAIGPAEDRATAWLLYLRAWGTTAFAYQPQVKDDLERALPIAVSLGDRRLELEVRYQLESIAAEDGSISRRELNESTERLAAMAQEVGNWPFAVRTLRVAAQMAAEEDPAQAEAHLARAAEIAEARALTEELGWLDYTRTEIGLVTGDWDAAWTAGMRALDLADRNAYHRVQVRTWFALSPIAAARGSRDLLQRARRWFVDHDAIFPGSPFGNVMHAAVDVRLTEAGLVDRAEPDLTRMLPAWGETQGLPSWFAAVETIVDAWLRAGRTEPARQVLDRATAWRGHPIMSRLGRGSVDLVESRVLLAEGANDAAANAARTALGEFEMVRARWWMAKAIRSLDAAGGATPEEVALAGEIERMLGLVGPAR